MNAEARTSLSTQLEARGMSPAQYHTLQRNLYPGAAPDSILMVWDYCATRKLDPMKKPCHIVPMKVTDAQTGAEVWRDVVMPGIYEYRTTAQRTGEYLGHAKPEYGPTIQYLGVEAPEWCDFTVYRWNSKANQRAEYTVRVYFREVAGTAKDKKTGKFYVNGRWQKAPIQMLTKCAEAAALREAFPDELGGEMTVDEMIDQEPINVSPPPPATYDQAKFDSQLPAFSNLIEAGTHTAESIIATLESKAPLTEAQKQELRNIKTIIEGEIDNENS